MDTLRKPCESCHKPMNGGLYRAAHICPHCGFEHATNKKKKKVAGFRAKSSSAIKPDSPARQEGANKEFTPRGPAGLPEVEEEIQQPAIEPVYAHEPAPSAAEADTAISDEAEPVYAREPEPETEFAGIDTADETPSAAAAEVDTSEALASATAEEQNEVEEKPESSTDATVATPTAEADQALDPNRARDVALTVKPAEEQNVVAYFEHVTSEQVINLPLTADLFENGKFLGTKSHKVKAVLQQGKKQALADLRNIAYDMGANMVASINLENKLKVIDKQTAQVTVVAVGSAISAELVEEAMEA